MRPLVKSSLRTRLIATIVLTTLPLQALIWYGAQRQFERESVALEQEVQRLTAFITGDINHLLETTRQMLLAVAKIDQATTAEQSDNIFTDLAQQSPVYEKFGVVYSDEKTPRATSPFHAVPAQLDKQLLRRALASNKLIVGKITSRTAGNKNLLCVAYPVAIKNETNQLAVSFVVLDFGWLDGLLSEERVTGNQSLFPRDMVLNILDRTGTILTRHPDQAKWAGVQFPDSLVLNEILKKGEGSADLIGVTGVKRFYAFKSVEAAAGDIIVCIGVSRETALVAAQRDLHRNLMGVTAIEFGLILATWFGTGLFITKPLTSLVETTRLLGAGDLSARTGITRGPQEITHLAEAFDHMAETMQQDTRERERMQGTLVEYDHQLRSMAVETVLAEEQERRQIAAGLHDKAGPLLATCYMKLGRALKLAAPSAVANVLNESRELINQTIVELRTLTFDLSSPALYTLGLMAAVEELCRDTASHHALLITCHNQGTPNDLSNDARVVLYRAARELLFNVVKHAEATHVTVTCGGDAEEVFVSVADDGVGFDADEAGRGFSRTGGFGLFNLRERLAHLGGRFTVESSRSTGTRVVVALPVLARDEALENTNDDPGISG